MVNYNNSTIYKLCCKDINVKEIYIGSTANDLRRRKSEHKASSKNDKNKSYNLKVYKFIRDNGNFQNWDIIEIERYKAIDKQDLHKRERYWLELLEATLNYQIPTRTQEEWFKNNNDELKRKNKEYKEKNKDKAKEKYEKNKERVKCNICNNEMNKTSLSNHKKKFHN
jgi:hypothetical protein